MASRAHEGNDLPVPSQRLAQLLTSQFALRHKVEGTVSDPVLVIRDVNAWILERKTPTIDLRRFTYLSNGGRVSREIVSRNARSPCDPKSELKRLLSGSAGGSSREAYFVPHGQGAVKVVVF